MADWADEMAAKHRDSTLPVSVFFLITTPEGVTQMASKLAALQPWGVTTGQINFIAAVAHEVRLRHTPADSVEVRIRNLWFAVGDPDWPDGRRPGALTIRNVPEKGFEVELELPGVVASRASNFRGDGTDGFFCAFLPPSIYRPL
jgi:hypothetical protein